MGRPKKIVEEKTETHTLDLFEVILDVIGGLLLFGGIAWLLGHEVFAVGMIWYGIRVFYWKNLIKKGGEK